MSKNGKNSKNGKPPADKEAARDDRTPVGAYYRMSDDKQDNSIERQRSQVEPYAARHGYRIVREYLDEGIPGDEEGRRKGFMQLLEDARRGEFSVILCDDKDRFGRFDSITQGYYVKPLRDAGVRLETVAQGRVDWFSFAGRITDAVLQEAKKLESQANSRRVITRMLMMARQGKHLGGPPPYGYRLESHPELGKRLVPGDPDKVEAVRLMFRLYGEEGHSLNSLSAELHRRGIANPRGGPAWDTTTLAQLLRNRKYVGDWTWNTGHDGKYSEFVGGAVQSHDGKTPKRAHNPQEDWVIVPDTHEPLISRELYEKVRARLADNKARTTPLPRSDQFILTGLLVCGHCGWRMTGTTHGGVRYFHCEAYHAYGKHVCYANYIKESRVVDCLLRKLQEALLDPANLERVRAEVRRLEAEEARGQPDRARGLERQLADLDQKIAGGMERLALIDRELLADFTATLRGWKVERDRLSVELRRVNRPGPAADVEAVVRAVESRLGQLRESLAEADPFQVREVLREMVSKVELHFDIVPRKGKTRSLFRRGLIHVRPQEGLDLSSILLSDPHRGYR
jgi:site-specific DNA recombinase